MQGQIMYAIAAMAIVSLLNLIAVRNNTETALQLRRNEVLSEVSGIATEILEDIGARPFDARTDTSVHKYPPRNPNELTPVSDFGGECDPELDCWDIDDFHNKTFHRDRDGIPFDASIEVAYVDQDDPDTILASQSFSKAVFITVTSPTLFNGTPDKPMEITTARVFSFMHTGI